MKISVITIAYNSAKTIEATIKSVLAQDGVELEYIIIDGGSQDGTQNIIEKYQSRIAHYVSEPDRGIYDAMNKGLARATGEVIGILNSDDTFAYPDVLSDIAALIQDKDAVYADLEYVDAITGKVKRKWRSGVYQSGSFLKGWMPPHPTFFVRKTIYDQYGYFLTDHGTAADYEIMLRFIHRYNIQLAYLPEVITRMKIGGASNATWKHRLAANIADRKSWTINGLTPKWYTLWLKPLRKVSQWF
jgi:glycosyltransferase involved in cell wall biosynthesis